MAFTDESTSLRTGFDNLLRRLCPFSPYGKLMKERMRIFSSAQAEPLKAEWNLIESLLLAVAEKGDAVLEIETKLSLLRDVRGIVGKAKQAFALEDVELYEVRRFLELAGQLAEAFDKLNWALPSSLKLPAVPGLHACLGKGGTSGFYLDDGYDPDLAILRKEQRRLKGEYSRHKQGLQDQIYLETGRRFNPAGRMRVRKGDQEAVKLLADRADLSLVSETFSEIEFKIKNDEFMLSLDNRIAELQDAIEALEWSVRHELTKQVSDADRVLLAICRRLGRLDLLLAKARLALGLGWCKPELTPDTQFSLEDFTNPVISEHLSRQGLSFQPLSLRTDSPVTVITGANMGGKSVLLKSLGLAVAMAQIGLLVPAKSFKFSLRDFIYYSQQDEDPGQGLSTFGAEVHSLSSVLPLKGQRGLYLLDEPARGTNPWEGSALVKAIVSWLKNGNSFTVVATHFPGLSSLEGAVHYQVAGLAAAKLEQFSQLGAEGVAGLQNLMDYSLVPGRGEIPRDALKVAAFLGLEPEILDRAAYELGLSSGRCLE